jgi:hypothetical protein
VVVSWDEPQAIQVEVRPPPPAIAGAAVRPDRLTYLGPSIFFPSKGEWYEHMHRRLTRLAVVALRRYRAGRVVSTLSLGWETALAEAATSTGLPLTVLLPFKGAQSGWALFQRQRFGRLLAKADSVETLHQGKKAWMRGRAQRTAAARADVLLVLWDERDASVEGVIREARGSGTAVVNLWPSWTRYGGLAKPG